MDKYLFLDIDGVLNSENFYETSQDEQIREFFYKYPNLSEYDWWILSCYDPVAVKRLNRLIEETNCKLIVSSSWRVDSRLPTIFIKIGINHRIDGVTPYLPGQDRGVEIKQFLDEIKGDYVYCILDDDSDMLMEQEPYFINVSCVTGLTDEDVNKAIKILNNYDEH